MTVYHFKVEVIWVQKAISYQSNKAYSVTSASLFIYFANGEDWVWFLFWALSLHWFLSYWLIWRFTPFPFTISTPSIWFRIPFSFLISTYIYPILTGCLFCGLWSTYVSKCKNITRRRRNMVDSAFESWWSIFSIPKKILVIRTHPEELRVIKCITITHISTNFSQQYGQRMLTKGHLASHGCSCDFQRLKPWPLGLPKPYRTFPYDVPSPLTRLTICVIS